MERIHEVEITGRIVAISKRLLRFFGALGKSYVRSSENVMAQLRIKALKARPEELGISPSWEYSKVFGVVMDWPLGDQVVTVVGLCDGNGSLYTTGTFGVIGGISHESVRLTAQSLVKSGAQFYDLAKPAGDFLFPDRDRVRFYLLCFDGTRTLEAYANDLASGQNPLSSLEGKAQQLISELRTITEKKE